MSKAIIPAHVAIILDGNGRWAKKKGLPRTFGHYQGGRNIFRIATAAKELGIKKLTVYAFSTENWKRPEEEVKYLMSKPVELFYKNRSKIKDIDYKISFAGRRDRFSKELLEVINIIEKETKDYQEFELVVAADYGSYNEIVTAVNKLEKPITQKMIEENLMIKQPVDLLIRTSGEQRLSNFLLWQASYAELYFTKVFWPAFSKKELEKALKDYQNRNRRFGGLA